MKTDNMLDILSTTSHSFANHSALNELLKAIDHGKKKDNEKKS